MCIRDRNSPESNFEGGLWFNAILTWYQDDGGATSGWWGRLENGGGTTGWWKNKFTPSGFILTYDDINAGQDSTTPKANTINLNKTDVNGVARTKTVRSTTVSYTHLDVYKRQVFYILCKSIEWPCMQAVIVFATCSCRGTDILKLLQLYYRNIMGCCRSHNVRT